MNLVRTKEADNRAELATRSEVRDIMWSRYTRLVMQEGLQSKRTQRARAIYVQALQSYYKLAAEVHRVRDYR